MSSLEVIIALGVAVSHQAFRHTPVNNSLAPRPYTKHSLAEKRQACAGSWGWNLFYHSNPHC